MPLFKERGPDVIDLVDLQKRGILKKSSQQIERREDDFVDFSKQSSSSPVQSSSPSSFDFLNSLASSASPSSPSSLSSSETTDSTQLSSLKVKLEDLEYKLDRFIDRIVALESKLSSTD